MLVPYKYTNKASFERDVLLIKGLGMEPIERIYISKFH
jgi:hypothetical protein